MLSALTFAQFLARSGLLVALGLLLLCKPAAAQQRQTSQYPPRQYYLSREYFHDGQFADALEAFQRTSRGGIRSTEGRWVDSICYYTMMGECFYEMGKLGDALDQYRAALKLFLAHQHWMLRVDFPSSVAPEQRARRPIPWGPTKRRAVPGRFPDRVPILQGQSLAENERAIVQGGVVALPEYYLINAHEIARCTALAIRRHGELMGAAGEHDSLIERVYQALSSRPARPNHWSEAWVNVQLGLAGAAAGKDAQAISELNKGLLIAGQFDHPLTATALLQLGKLAFEKGQYGEAATSFLEASISAARFSQYALVEESLRWGALTHLVTGQDGVYRPLEPAATWARRDARYLQTSTLVAVAENYAVLNETSAGARQAENARRAMARTNMLEGAVGARYKYVSALLAYQRGNLQEGDASFASLMDYQSGSSRRLFEISLVDRLFTSNQVSERVANELYGEVLREPTAKDWVVDPVETLSVVLTPHEQALQHWFEAALQRKEYEQAVEVADRIRRHRFYRSLPMGGRLLALRWVLEGPEEALSEEAQLQRRELTGRFTKYGELSRHAADIKKRLDGKPLLPAEEDARRDQGKWLTQLESVSRMQEVLLREVALRRAPSEFVFPPALDFKKLQSELPPGQLVLSFLATSRHVYAFVFGNDTYDFWRLEASARVRPEIAGLLRGMGHVDKNRAVEIEKLQDDTWKETGEQILQQLTNKAKPKIWDSFDELIIVPDGPLWYVPFEALQIKQDEQRVPVISKVRVRYAPTVSTVLPDERRTSPIAETAVVAGQLFPRDDEGLADAAMAQLSEVLPRVTPISGSLTGPAGVFATFCQRLVVLSDLEQNPSGPYDWSPLPVSRGTPGTALAKWMSLPWGGPQQVVLPGFHTPAENGLKNGGSGNDIFLAVCGLMSTGARTVLISRWRTGGQSSYDLVREFVQELPYTSAADAWQRSVHLSMENPLSAENEPRVKAARLEKGLKTEHPFFWAGYLLVDTGALPTVEEPEVIEEPEPSEEAEPSEEVVAGEESAPGDEDAETGDSEKE